MKKYPYGFANYPKKFKGYIVSPAKICLQYTDVDIKLRPLGEPLEGLPKVPEGGVAVPITQAGNNINLLAVGHYIGVLEPMQLGLIDAYRAYYKEYGEGYKEVFDRDFRDFLSEVHLKLGEVIEELNYLK